MRRFARIARQTHAVGFVQDLELEKEQLALRFQPGNREVETDAEFFGIGSVKVEAIRWADDKLEFEIEPNFEFDIPIHTQTQSWNANVEIDWITAGVQERGRFL